MTRRRTMALAVVLALAAPFVQASAAPAASRDLAAQRAAMARLSFLHGRWTGEARVTRPDGSVVVSRSDDEVVSLLDGLVLTVKGSAYAPGAPADAKPVGENYGILSFDERAGRYDVRAYAAGEAQGGHGSVLADGSAQWFLEGPDRRVRFTVRADGPDGWIEIVEFSTDGANWKPGMEIRFRRAR